MFRFLGMYYSIRWKVGLMINLLLYCEGEKFNFKIWKNELFFFVKFVIILLEIIIFLVFSIGIVKFISIYLICFSLYFVIFNRLW